ncbi:unnamed protein product [Hymenolepis diminuta]|uniref:Uncharacterized protein n=1 Tax=Hymenolepis diminuta TaxID=6216 RepID=A0A564YIX0_HYMDI|nr:unnamed protein product [Hymenolepis diminuta]
MGRQTFHLSSSSNSSSSTVVGNMHRNQLCANTSMSDIETIPEEFEETPNVPANINRINVKNFVSFTPNINLSLPECQFTNSEGTGVIKAQEILSAAMPAMMESIEQCLQLASRYLKPSESSHFSQDLSRSHQNGKVLEPDRSSNIQIGVEPIQMNGTHILKTEDSLTHMQKVYDSSAFADQMSKEKRLPSSNCDISDKKTADEACHVNGCKKIPPSELSESEFPTSISHISIKDTENGASEFNRVKCEEDSATVSLHAANINKYLTFLQEKYNTRITPPNVSSEETPLNAVTINSLGQPFNQSINEYKENSASLPKVSLPFPKDGCPTPPKLTTNDFKTCREESKNSNSQKEEIDGARSIIWTTMAQELWKILFSELYKSNSEEIVKNLTNQCNTASCSRVVTPPQKPSHDANGLFPVNCDKCGS